MKRKPRKYQNKLILYPTTFEQVADRVLAYRPPKRNRRKKKVTKKIVLK
jgi:hypothetical protein